MTAKEYLDSYKLIQTRINVLRAEIYRLRAEAESASINIDGLPKTQGSGDKIANIAIELAEAESTLRTEMNGLYMRRMRIIEQLGQLKSHKHQQLLHKRYIECKSWEHIAVEMEISWRYCYMLHGSALAEFDKIINKN